MGENPLPLNGSSRKVLPSGQLSTIDSIYHILAFPSRTETDPLRPLHTQYIYPPNCDPIRFTTDPLNTNW